MPDMLFNLLLLFSAVVFLSVFLRAWRVTIAQRRSAGIRSSGDAGVRESHRGSRA